MNGSPLESEGASLPVEDSTSPKPGSQDATLKLQQLRELIVSPDVLNINELQASIDEIENELRDPEFMMQMLMPVLEPTIQKIISKHRSSFATTLAPVMPSAMNKGIVLTLKQTLSAIWTFFLNVISFGAYSRQMGGPPQTGDVDDDYQHCFTPEAVFLIHKQSKDTIVDLFRNKHISSREKKDYMEGLTDIASNKVDDLGDETSIPPFSYGNSKVMVESGRNCYIIIVLRDGWMPTPSFLFQVRQGIANIEHHYLKEVDINSSEADAAIEDINLIIKDLLTVDGVNWIHGGRGAPKEQTT